MTVDKVIGARFAAMTENAVTVKLETSTPVAGGRKATLYRDNDIISVAEAVADERNACICTAEFSVRGFVFTSKYAVKIDGIHCAAQIAMSGLVDERGFIAAFENADTQSCKFGAEYSAEKTTFRVWAPFAAAVMLKLYADGAVGGAFASYAMKKRVSLRGEWGGVWELALEGDHDGVYYTYTVNNYGAETTTIDPYAKACGVNGARGMVIDLRATDPQGWENDRRLYVRSPLAADTPVVWETAVGDFSASPDSGMKYKGKYLAFTERGTTVPGTDIKTGVDYLKELGVTYVHLNPVYDFATVDEGDLGRADCDAYNWGYDPQNYNIPEGSYSTDPADGATRIREFKQMVMALHAAGIGVIMDVVYNHTYTTGGQALHDTAPYYYHRTDENGAFTNDSGCGNGTASERTMMRKYIVESVLYWATEYHLDGFRFDLMGVHDAVTLNAIRAELDRLDGGRGRKILMYGEPWSADGTYTPASYGRRVAATAEVDKKYKFTSNADNRLMKHIFADAFVDERAFDALDPRIAVFNGSGRDGLRGACMDKSPQKGWVNGAPTELGKVKKMIEGGIGGYADGLATGLGSRNVAYASAHDNYTLWDHLRGATHGNASTLFYDKAEYVDVKRNKLVAAAYLISTGICFMLAGEETGRTKYGNEDSYNSPQKLNAIRWSRRREFGELFEFYKRLIALRKRYNRQLFSYAASTDAEYSYGVFEIADYETGRFVFKRERGGATLTVELDPSTLSGYIDIDGRRLEI